MTSWGQGLLHVLSCFCCPPSLDYSTGFGGKYGVQKDSQDSSAVGWDHQEHLAKHDSQKGKYDNPIERRGRCQGTRPCGRDGGCQCTGQVVVSAPDRSLSVHQTTRCQCTGQPIVSAPDRSLSVHQTGRCQCTRRDVVSAPDKSLSVHQTTPLSVHQTTPLSVHRTTRCQCTRRDVVSAPDGTLSVHQTGHCHCTRQVVVSAPDDPLSVHQTGRCQCTRQDVVSAPDGTLSVHRTTRCQCTRQDVVSAPDKHCQCTRQEVRAPDDPLSVHWDIEMDVGAPGCLDETGSRGDPVLKLHVYKSLSLVPRTCINLVMVAEYEGNFHILNISAPQPEPEVCLGRKQI